MVPILPITTSDVEDEPDAVAADGKLDASNKKLSTTSDTLKFKLKELGRILIEPYDKEKDSQKPKSKCDVVVDIVVWILGVVALFILGFNCGEIYYHRKVETWKLDYNKVTYQKAQRCYQKYQELHQVAQDLEAKLKSRIALDTAVQKIIFQESDLLPPSTTSTPDQIQHPESVSTINISTTTTELPIKTPIVNPAPEVLSSDSAIMLQLKKLISDTQKNVDKFSETFLANFKKIIRRGVNHDQDESISLDNIKDEIQSAFEKLSSFSENTIKDFESMIISSQWMFSLDGIKEAVEEVKKKVAETVYVRLSDSSTVDEIVESLKKSMSQYTMKVENDFEDFLNKAKAALDTEYGDDYIITPVDDDNEEK